MKRVLILCEGNSGRGHMAEGWMRQWALDLVVVDSAGLEQFIRWPSR